MNFPILIIFSILTGILGQEVPDEYLSTLDIPLGNLSGPWYLVYWGEPADNPIYPGSKNVKCYELWVTAVNDTLVEVDIITITENNTQNWVTVTYEMTPVSEDKYYYRLQALGQDFVLKPIAFDKWKYFAGHTYFEDKKYLFVYARDPHLFMECDNDKRIAEWINDTTILENPAYKINPHECACAN